MFIAVTLTGFPVAGIPMNGWVCVPLIVKRIITLVAFRDELLRVPLDIRHGSAHHVENGDITVEAAQGFGRGRSIEDYVGRDNGFSDGSVARVDEADELLHYLLVSIGYGRLIVSGISAGGHTNCRHDYGQHGHYFFHCSVVILLIKRNFF